MIDLLKIMVFGMNPENRNYILIRILFRKFFRQPDGSNNLISSKKGASEKD